MCRKHINFYCRPSLSLHYSKVKPLKIVYGRGQYLYDENDQPYMDCINNVTQGIKVKLAIIAELWPPLPQWVTATHVWSRPSPLKQQPWAALPSQTMTCWRATASTFSPTFLINSTMCSTPPQGELLHTFFNTIGHARYGDSLLPRTYTCMWIPLNL